MVPGAQSVVEGACRALSYTGPGREGFLLVVTLAVGLLAYTTTQPPPRAGSL